MCKILSVFGRVLRRTSKGKTVERTARPFMVGPFIVYETTFSEAIDFASEMSIKAVSQMQSGSYLSGVHPKFGDCLVRTLVVGPSLLLIPEKRAASNQGDAVALAG